MSNKYDNIDYCLNMLYDFVYTTPSECYELKYEPNDKITLEQLKKPADFDIELIFKDKIVFEQNINNKLIFKRTSVTGYPCMIRIFPYSTKNINYNDLSREELIDMKLNYILSGLAINDVHKYILFPIMNFDVTLNDIKNKDVVDKLKKSYGNINADSVFCVQVFEHYFKLKTLTEYLTENHNKFTKLHWQVLIFQILYALYKIQKNHPSFRHNNLDLNSIYVYVKNETHETKQFKIENKIFDVPNMGFEIKITNFYKSYIENLTNDNKSKDNQFYDVYSILTALSLFMNKYNIKEYGLQSFIDEVIPDKIKSNNIKLDEDYYFQYITNISNPLIILTKNNFFIDLINKMKSTKSNNPRSPDDGSIDYLLSSSSLTETGYGSRPSMLGKSNNRTITGQRTLAVSSKKKLSGGARRKKQVFNDYGELETEKAPMKNKNKDEDSEESLEEPSEKSSEQLEEINEEIESEENVIKDDENDEEEEEEDEEEEEEEKKNEDSDSENFDNVKEPRTEGPPVSGTGELFRILGKKNKKPLKPKVVQKIQRKGSKGKQSKKSRGSSERSPKARSRVEKSGKSMSKIEEGLLSKLPDDYSGMMPDWMQSLVPPPQAGQQMPYGNFGQDQMMAQQMMQPQMMQPQMMPQMMQPQMMQPQMMSQQMGQFSPQMSQSMQFSETSNQLPQYSANFTETSASMNNMSDLFMPSSQPVNSGKAQMFNGLSSLKQSLSHTASELDNTSYLPPHLLMNGQQAKMMNANMPQRGGKDFFF